MKYKYLLLAYLLLGFLEVFLPDRFFNLAVSLRPINVAIIYCFYVGNTKQHNYLLLFYLVCELLNEIFFLIDFTKYFTLVLSCYSIATFTMIYHLWPVLKSSANKADAVDWLRPGLGLLAIFYMFWRLSLMVFDELPNNSIFFVGVLALVCWSVFCFLVPVKNKHPDNFALYFMGGAMAVMAPSMFIYEFIWTFEVILYFSLLSMLLFKIFLVWYLIQFKYILRSQEEYF